MTNYGMTNELTLGLNAMKINIKNKCIMVTKMIYQRVFNYLNGTKKLKLTFLFQLVFNIFRYFSLIFSDKVGEKTIIFAQIIFSLIGEDDSND